MNVEYPTADYKMSTPCRLSTTVLTTPMTSFEYSNFRGWSLASEAHADDGFLVIDPAGESNMPGRSGHVSWIPTKEFERLCTPITELVNLPAKDDDENVTDDDSNTFKLLNKTSNKTEGWTKSTRAMQLHNGCLIKILTQLRNPHGGDYAISEALAFVPDVRIVANINGGWKLAAMQE